MTESSVEEQAFWRQVQGTANPVKEPKKKAATAEPPVTEHGDIQVEEMADGEGCIVHIAANEVSLDFQVAGLVLRRRELLSDVSVSWHPLSNESHVGVPNRPLAKQSVNWRSHSAVDNLGRRLASYYEQLGLPWKVIVEWLASAVEQYTVRAGELAEAEWIELPTARYALQPIIADSGVTIWFGPGESAKGYIACAALFALGYGEALWNLRPQDGNGEWWYLDYEDSKREWDARLTRLATGLDRYLPPNVYRIPGRGVPFSEQAESLLERAKGRNLRGLFIDSALPAAGGDALDSETVRQFFAATARFNCPVCLIAHETKAENDFYPFGSIFWHNLARQTINFRSALAGPIDRHVLLRSRKRNNGRHFEDLAFSVAFSDDEAHELPAWTRVKQLRVTQLTSALQEKRRAADRLEEFLTNHPNQTVTDLAESLGLNSDTIKTALHADRRFVAEGGSRGRGNASHWRVLSGIQTEEK